MEITCLHIFCEFIKYLRCQHGASVQCIFPGSLFFYMVKCVLSHDVRRTVSLQNIYSNAFFRRNKNYNGRFGCGEYASEGRYWMFSGGGAGRIGSGFGCVQPVAERLTSSARIKRAFFIHNFLIVFSFSFPIPSIP